MKTLYKAVGAGIFAIAAWSSLAGVAQASGGIENWVLEGGGCYSPQLGDNDCNICGTFQCVATPVRLCEGECGTHGGKRILSKWVALIE
ncbi:hypothetical protein [Polyangium sp. y55x31]|uniref:hypothetical protein n=1 Tax=Polyangium sp. y55x31 TaxID=3042688 RepID=UPI0024829261|nr:hypothetical protein [Polyangium sp. y55x31]MDI1483448.1 hypothetical protein [Polyangium sp. y55x31]